MPGPSNLLDIISEDSIAYLAQSSEAEANTKANLTKQAETATEISDQQKQLAQDKATVALTEQTAALNAQKLFQGAMSKAGLSPIGTANVIASNIDILVDAGNRRNVAAKKYEESKKGTIFELGPVDWFKKRYEGGEARIDMEHATRQQQIAAGNLEVVNKAISESQRMSAAVQESITAASVSALTRIAASDADVKSKQYALDALKYNGAAINVAKEASKERLAVLYNVNAAIKGEKQFELQLKAFAQSEEEFEWRKNQKVIEDAAKKEQKDVDGFMLDRINVGRANRGLPPLEGREAKTMVQILKSGGEGSKELGQDYQRGVATLTTGIPVLGKDPASTAELLVTNKTALPEQRQKVAEILVSSYRAVAENPQLYPKPEDKAAAVNKMVTEKIRADFASIRAKSGNVFDFGDLASYIELTGVKDLPVVTKVLQPAAKSGQPLDDPKVYTGLIADAIYKGTITTSEGMELSTIAQKANEVHQAASGFKASGIAVPLDGKAYNVNLGYGTKLNLTNAQDLARFLNQLLADKAYGQRQLNMGIDPRQYPKSNMDVRP